MSFHAQSAPKEKNKHARNPTTIMAINADVSTKGVDVSILCAEDKTDREKLVEFMMTLEMEGE